MRMSCHVFSLKVFGPPATWVTDQAAPATRSSSGSPATAVPEEQPVPHISPPHPRTQPPFAGRGGGNTRRPDARESSRPGSIRLARLPPSIFSAALIRGSRASFGSAAFEQHPTQAVEIGLILLYWQKRLANHRLGLLEVLPLLCIKIPQVVVGAGLIRKTLEQPLELGLALGVVSLIDVARPKGSDESP